MDLMDEYGSYLMRTAYLLLKDHQLAEEVVQDVFIKAYQNADQLKEARKMKYWLTSIVYNESRSHMRKWAFKNVFVREPSQLPEQIEDRYQPDVALLKADEFGKLTAAILTLHKNQREVIILYYYNELSIREIAQLTHAKENTVKSRMKRARAALKTTLNERES